jgi:hypothetical protein
MQRKATKARKRFQLKFQMRAEGGKRRRIGNGRCGHCSRTGFTIRSHGLGASLRCRRPRLPPHPPSQTRIAGIVGSVGTRSGSPPEWHRGLSADTPASCRPVAPSRRYGWTGTLEAGRASQTPALSPPKKLYLFLLAKEASLVVKKLSFQNSSEPRLYGDAGGYVRYGEVKGVVCLLGHSCHFVWTFPSSSARPDRRPLR